jgi:uncharacterized protein YecE (DUF72 family)
MPKRPRVEPFRNPTLFEMDKLEEAGDVAAKREEVERPYSEPGLLLGTSSFTATGWSGTFYPAGMKPPDYLSFYATRFKTVEIDSTYYGPPSASELGPLVFQFPFFDRWKFPKQEDFVAVLTPFLKKLPADHKFAIEIRTKTWLDSVFADLLREHKVALVLQDLSSMPRPWEQKEKFDFVTADFVYVRWLGDRKGIEEETKTWDKTVADRRGDLVNWVELFRRFMSRNLKVFAYANNHYAGNGTGTVKLFWELYNAPAKLSAIDDSG